MYFKHLPVLLLGVAIAYAAPIIDISINNAENLIQIPIFNPNHFNISQAHASDIQRWAALTDNDIDFSAEATPAGYGLVPAANYITNYRMICTLGTPPTELELIFDTGSSTLWVQPQFFSPTLSSTIQSTGETFEIEYGSAKTSGGFFTDRLTLDSKTVNQDFGIATTVAGLGPTVHGLIGFGPDSLTRNTNTQRLIPTPLDNFVASGQINSKVFGVYFTPLAEGVYSGRNGMVTLGGYDRSRFTGDIMFANPTNEYPANQYWGLDFDKVLYGSILISARVSGISDTGTSLILLSPPVFNGLTRSIPGARIDANGLLAFPVSSVASLRPITFVVNGNNLSLTPNQYMLRPGDVRLMGGAYGMGYAWIGLLPQSSGLDIFLGQKFLEHYYSIYDGINNRVGFAVAR